jgi:hypothetical protein
MEHKRMNEVSQQKTSGGKKNDRPSPALEKRWSCARPSDVSRLVASGLLAWPLPSETLCLFFELGRILEDLALRCLLNRCSQSGSAAMLTDFREARSSDNARSNPPPQSRPATRRHGTAALFESRSPDMVSRIRVQGKRMVSVAPSHPSSRFHSQAKVRHHVLSGSAAGHQN